MINLGFLASHKTQQKAAELSDSKMNCSQKPSYTSLEPTAASTQHTATHAAAPRRSLDRPGHAPTPLDSQAAQARIAIGRCMGFFTEIPTDTRLQIHQQIGDTD